MMNLNEYIDHTVLKPETTAAMVKKICDEAKQFNFATVCINPARIAEAKKLLAGSNVGITTVIGFPLGANTTEVKVFETSDAIKKGADEIDMVINIGAVKDGNWDLVQAEMQAIKQAAGTHCVKVILENCLLTEGEIVKACEVAVAAGLDFVKTSTGFSTGGATFADVALMKKTVGDRAKVKAAGGVRTYDDAERLGTSGGVAIVQGKQNNESY
jgi:deoxyribose-phosphate aldolase